MKTIANVLHCKIRMDKIWTSYFFLNDYDQGSDFDYMSSFFPCEIDDAIQYINLGYGAQAPKIVLV